MQKLTAVLIIIYLSVVIYLANWIGLAVFVTVIGAAFLSSRLLKIRTFVDFKLELKSYWGEAITAATGSILLTYIVHLESNGDFRVSLTFAVFTIPGAFLLGYFWLRGVNKVFSILKSKIIGTKK